MPKTQSALLEAMAERQVTVDGVTRELPEPFLLLATENPIEYEGTFPLPEAQLDRFFLKTALGYPGVDDELRILDEQRYGHPLDQLEPVVDARRHRTSSRAAAQDVYVDDRAPALDRRPRARDARARRRRDRQLGARQPRARARRARVGAPPRSRRTSSPRTSSGSSCPCSCTGSSSGRLPRRGARDGGWARGDRRASASAASSSRRARAPRTSTSPSVPDCPWPTPTVRSRSSRGGRLVGLSFGAMRSARRGAGSDVAGSRPYRPGDDVDTIDWDASARLSSARGTRRVHRPRALRRRGAARRRRLRPPAGDGALSRRRCPWLAKPDGDAHARRARLRRARSRVARLHRLPRLRRRRGRTGGRRAARAGAASDGERSAHVVRRAPEDTLERALEHLAEHRPRAPAGSFVFVLSDFLARRRTTPGSRRSSSAGTSCRS